MPQNKNITWKMVPGTWIYISIVSVIILIIFRTGLINMVDKWSAEEYSYAYILPLIIIYYFWQQKDNLKNIAFSRSWAGPILLASGLLLYFTGELSSLFILIQYGFVITVSGILYILFGYKGITIIWPVFILMLFMIPLPNFFLNNLSAELQLISSKIGVIFIRIFDISVHLEGNIIDLGKMKLQVVDACSGLRYLFPLMALGFIAALFYRTTLWKRIVLFFSTIPITVIMNSIRIGIIGVTVEYFGKQAAEGFLHDFEGWAIFLVCTSLLVLEMWLFTKIGADKRPLSVVFSIDDIEKNKQDSLSTTEKNRELTRPIFASLVLLAITLLASFNLTSRSEIIPERDMFVNFPTKFENWIGNPSSLKSIFLDELKLSDYLMINYKNSSGVKINFYSAYYNSQRAGQSAHSPRTCIPGGGWRIKQINDLEIDSIRYNNKPLTVNRTLVQHGDYKQLVYYWFQQRGRVITNEYLVKWYLFWDSLTQNRTDGALVRLTIPLSSKQSAKDGDKILQEFMQKIIPLLPEYIPN